LLCFEIHLSVQAPFQGAGIVEYTVLSQHRMVIFRDMITNVDIKGPYDIPVLEEKLQAKIPVKALVSVVSLV
jgi:hypothetical protein